MSHVYEGPLATYNSLLDPHLAGYFSNTSIRRHLKKSKLITRKGEVITESKYRLLNARAEHRKQVRDMLAQAIVNKTLDMERQRQSEVRRRLEKIAKIELVKKVRAERKFGYEDTIMDLLRSPSEVRRKRLEAKNRSDSLPTLSGRRQSTLSSRSSRSTTPRHRDEKRHRGRTNTNDSSSRSASRSRSHSKSQSRGSGLIESFSGSFSDESQSDGRHVLPLKEKGARTQPMQRRDGGESPQLPLTWKPHPPPKKPPPQTPRDEHGRPIKTKKHVRGRHILHRQEPAFKHERDVQTFCDVTLKYLGGAYSPYMQQEIVVEQQHCGGSTLTVFKEFVKPKSNFTFTSKRHKGFPFGLTLYIDGHQNATVSTCCEYKHRKGALLGSKTSHFKFVKVTGAKPCFKCEVEAELSEKAEDEKKQRDNRKQQQKPSGEKNSEEGRRTPDETAVEDVQAANDDYGSDFEADEYEKNVEDDEFEAVDEEENVQIDSTRSTEREVRHQTDDEKTSREVKGFVDELEPQPPQQESARTSSSRGTSSQRSVPNDSKEAVQVAVGDSEDELSTKEIVEHYLESISRQSPTNEGKTSLATRSDDPREDKRSPKSSRSSRSSKASSSRQNENARHDVNSENPDKHEDDDVNSARSEKSVKSNRSSSSDVSSASKHSSNSKKSAASVTSHHSNTSAKSNGSVKSEISAKSKDSKNSAKSVESVKSKDSKNSASSVKSKGSKKSSSSVKSKDSKNSASSVKSKGSKKSSSSVKSKDSKKSTGSAKSKDSRRSSKSNQSKKDDETVKSDGSAESDDTLSPETNERNDEDNRKASNEYEKASNEYEKTSDGYEKTSDGYEKTSDGYEKTSNEYEKTSDGYEKTSDGYEKTSDGYVESDLSETNRNSGNEADNTSDHNSQKLSSKEDSLELRDVLEIQCKHENDKNNTFRVNDKYRMEMPKLLEELRSASELTALSMKDCKLTNSDVDSIANSLAKSDCPLQSLDLSGNQFGISGCLALISSLVSSKASTLLSLRLNDSPITQAGVEELVKVLVNKRINLKSLYLHNCIQDEELMSGACNKQLCELISFKSLKELSVSHVPAPEIKSLTRGLSQDCPNMDYLELSSCLLSECITPLTCPVVFDAGFNLNTLSLRYNNLRDNHVAILIKNWSSRNCKIKSVVVSPGNNVSLDGETQLTKFTQSSLSDASGSDDTIESGDDSSHVSASSSSVTGKPPLPPKTETTSDSKVEDSAQTSDSKVEDRMSTTADDKDEDPSHSDAASSSDDVSDDSESESVTSDQKVKEKKQTEEHEKKVLVVGDGDEDDVADIINMSSDQTLDRYLSHTDEIRLANLDRDQLIKLIKYRRDITTVKLRHVDLSNNTTLNRLAASLKHQDTLKALVLSSCRLTSESCPILAEVIMKHLPSLSLLSLRDNPDIGDRGIADLLRGVLLKSEADYNRRLDLKAKEIVTQSVKGAFGSASSRSIVSEDSSDEGTRIALDTLVLSSCKIGNSSLEKLSQIIKYGVVKDMRLAQSSNVTQIGWKVFLNSLHHNSTKLKNLDISYNSLGRHGMITGSPLLALAGLKLESLNLTHNQISSNHVEQLSADLRNSSTRIGVMKLQPGNELTSDDELTLYDSSQ